MEIENYEIWEPIVGLPDSSYFFELHNCNGALTILLKEFGSLNKTLKVNFSSTLGYRVVNEAGRLRSFNNSSMMTYCKSVDSSFLRWFKAESEGIFDDWSLTHFVICNSDNIIDVITNLNPEVKWQVD
jgi:hypothetical protein